MRPLKMQNSKLNGLPTVLIVSILFLHAIVQYSSISVVAGHVDKEEKEVEPAKSPVQTGANVDGQQDIIINTIDSDSIKPVGNRHLYEQPSESASTATQPKPESRNQEDNSVQSGPIQLQQSDPPIIDHRPSSTEVSDSNAFAQLPSTSTPQTQTITVVSTGPTQATTQGQAQSQSTGPAQTANQPVYNQNGPPSNWYPQQLPVLNAYGGQTQNQIQPTNGFAPGSAAAASNQVVTMQHPNSINAIISDQQQQPQQQLQQPSASSNQQILQSNTQGQLVSVNGQPASVILVGPSNPLNGGRRMAYISNWFKGLSSMLANIFNRRDHGGQIVAAPGGPMGHWIQLGSNSPHWLSQAQTAIQQLQQQQVVSALGSTPSRFASFMQGQPATSQSTVAVSMQPFAGSQVSNQQVPNGFQTGELQMSGSSTSYIAVQAPQTQNHQSNNQLLLQPSQSSIHHHATTSPFQPVNQMSPVISSDSLVSTRSARASPGQTQVQQPSQPPSSIQQQARTGGQQSIATLTQTTRAPTRFGRSSDQNLPLAHYSRLGESRADKV